MKKYIFFIIVVLGILIYTPSYATDPEFTVTNDLDFDNGTSPCWNTTFGDCALLPFSDETEIVPDVPYTFDTVEVTAVNSGSGNNCNGQGNYKLYILSTSTIAEVNVVASSTNSAYWGCRGFGDPLSYPTVFYFASSVTVDSPFYMGYAPVDHVQAGVDIGVNYQEFFYYSDPEQNGYSVQIINLTNGYNYWKPKFLMTTVTSPLPRQNTLREIVYHTTSTKENAFEVQYIPITDLSSESVSVPSIMDFDVSTSTWILTEVDLFDVGNNTVRASSSVYWHYEYNATTTHANKLKDLFDKIKLTVEDCTASTTLWSLIQWNSSVDYIACQSSNLLKILFNLGIIPADSLLDNVDNSWEALKDIFPFNVTFGIADIIGDEIGTATSSTSFVLPLFPTSTSVSITSTTVANFVGVSNYNTVRSFSEAVIWGLLGLAILFTIV